MVILSIEIFCVISNVGGKTANLNIIRLPRTSQYQKLLKNARQSIYSIYFHLKSQGQFIQMIYMIKLPPFYFYLFLHLIFFKLAFSSFQLQINLKFCTDLFASQNFYFFNKYFFQNVFFKKKFSLFNSFSFRFNCFKIVKNASSWVFKQQQLFFNEILKKSTIFKKSIKKVMKYCKLCHYQFSPVSTRFYCCNKEQLVCITCRRDICKICKSPRINQLIQPRCDKCYSRLIQNDLLFEYNCQKYYCSRCLSSVFKNAYSKVVLDRLYDQKNEEIFVKMYCGHEYPYNDLSNYFEHHCLECGRNYDMISDYQLNDGVKLCYFCIKSCQPKYRQCLIRCLGCDRILQNSSKAEVKDEQGMILCNNCVTASKIEENSILESRRVLEDMQKSRKNEQLKKIEEKSEINLNTKAQDPFKKPALSNKKSDLEKSSPLNKFLRKPSINQLKQKQAQRINSKNNNNDKTHSFSVTSKFSNQLEDIDDQLVKQLGIPKNIKMKKHLSNQTFVEHFKIQIPENKPQNFVKCRDCNSLVLRKMCFNVSQNPQKSLNKSIFFSFSTLESSFVQDKQNSQFLCRVCYYESKERKENKNFSSSKSRSNLDISRPSRLQQRKSSMNYLKVEQPGKRYRNSPSPSPNKQYSLTGSKHSSYSKEQPSSLKPNLSNIDPQKKPEKSYLYSQQQPKVSVQQKLFQKPNQIKIQHHPATSTKYKSPQSAQRKCGMCGNRKNSLFLTLNQGYLCDQCYYRKSPHTFKTY